MKDLIKYCRYYKEENEAPQEINKNGDGMLWFYEKLWVECDQESKMQQKWESECSIIGNSNTSKLGTIMQR